MDCLGKTFIFLLFKFGLFLPSRLSSAIPNILINPIPTDFCTLGLAQVYSPGTDTKPPVYCEFCGFKAGFTI